MAVVAMTATTCLLKKQAIIGKILKLRNLVAKITSLDD